MHPESEPGAAAPEISFEHAEVEEAPRELACTACEVPLTASYYEVNGAVVCERCRYAAEEEREQGSRLGRFVRALAGGTAGALVGAGIYYAILALTGYEVGLVAIVVGLLVGGGVRWGARARGGWAYQGLAIVLTYLAIVGTYVPFIVEAIGEMPEEAVEMPAEGAGATSDGELTLASAGMSLDADGAGQSLTEGEVAMGGAGAAVVAAVVVVVLAVAAPFLAGFENVIGILIIGFALYEAWKINRRVPLAIGGPYTIGSRAAAAPPSAADGG